MVARVTSATRAFFKSIKVGRYEIEFIDESFDIITHAKFLSKSPSGRGKIGILSIMTGLGDVVAMDKTRLSILNALKRWTHPPRRRQQGWWLSSAEHLIVSAGGTMLYYVMAANTTADRVYLVPFPKNKRFVRQAQCLDTLNRCCLHKRSRKWHLSDSVRPKSLCSLRI